LAYGNTIAKTSSGRNVHITFEIIKIAEYVDRDQSLHNIYVAQETGGYLSKLGEGVGVNTLIDVGPSAYLIVDPGPDGIYAKKLIETLSNFEKNIRSKRLVLINSVARPEHVLANSSLSTKQTAIYATKITQINMRARCPNCRKRLATQLENKSILRNPLKIPNIVIANGSFISEFPDWQVFEFSGRTESDMALWNSKSLVLYAGGLSYQDSIIDLNDGNSLSWINALEGLLELKPQYVIGVGLGKVKTGQQTLIVTKDYLESLRMATRQDFLHGGDAASADKCCNLEQYRSVLGYQSRHPLNVQHVWREIEQEEMNK
jgi:glyoxylase-like metal-dependent hydrolase (beta-lactamase superfamily II)